MDSMVLCGIFSGFRGCDPSLDRLLGDVLSRGPVKRCCPNLEASMPQAATKQHLSGVETSVLALFRPYLATSTIVSLPKL